MDAENLPSLFMHTACTLLFAAMHHKLSHPPPPPSFFFLSFLPSSVDTHTHVTRQILCMEVEWQQSSGGSLFTDRCTGHVRFLFQILRTVAFSLARVLVDFIEKESRRWSRESAICSRTLCCRCYERASLPAPFPFTFLPQPKGDIFFVQSFIARMHFSNKYIYLSSMQLRYRNSCIWTLIQRGVCGCSPASITRSKSLSLSLALLKKRAKEMYLGRVKQRTDGPE